MRPGGLCDAFDQTHLKVEARLIDTHTHLFSAKFDADRAEVIARALDAGVTRMYLPNIDVGSVEAMLVLAEAYPNVCLPMLGLHPTSVDSAFRQNLAALESRLHERPWAAIGEIGTDLYWSKDFWEEQQQAFLTQCEWALALDRPIAVHCRESIDETIALVEPLVARGLRGVFHCFTGSLAQARRLTGWGFYLGIGGVLTYKKAGDLPEVVRAVPPESLVLETDSPYLAPAPMRGRRNESAFVAHVNARLAELLELSPAAAAALTTANAERLFA